MDTTAAANNFANFIIIFFIIILLIAWLGAAFTAVKLGGLIKWLQGNSLVPYFSKVSHIFSVLSPSEVNKMKVTINKSTINKS